MKGRLFMSNIYTSYGSSPSLCSMFDSSKGSFGNRVDCTAHRMSNSARALAEESLLAGATYAGYKAINFAAKKQCFSWNESINSVLSKGAKTLQKIADCIKPSNGPLKYIKKTYKGLVNAVKSGCEKLTETSGKQKMLGLLGLAAITTLVAIERKHAFKEGQYDERYNIKAKICENRDM